MTYPLLPLQALGPDQGWKVACALAARHIGGAINFVAVSETLDVGGSAVSAAIAADNVVVALYFAFLFYLAKSGEDIEGSDNSNDFTSKTKGLEKENSDTLPIDPENISRKDGDGSSITMASIALSLTVASSLVSLGKIITKAILPKGASALPLISVLTVASATSFPQFFADMRVTGTAIGIIFMQMFFAASGAAGSIKLVIQSAPSLFLFSSLQIAVHFITLMGLGKFVFKLREKELYLASNANVGGPTTAAAMAQAKEWPRLVLPALLVGILGYASATPIALGLGQILLRIPIMSK